jgi:hypothetical protein
LRAAAGAVVGCVETVSVLPRSLFGEEKRTNSLIG